MLGPVRFKPTTQGDLLTASPDPLYTTRRMDLAVFDGRSTAWRWISTCCSGSRRSCRPDSGEAAILQALDDALDGLDFTDVPGTAAAAREVLAPALAQPAYASAHHISAVGHAHIDSAWLWPLRETVRKVARTVSNVVALAADNPGFVFAISRHSSTSG